MRKPNIAYSPRQQIKHLALALAAAAGLGSVSTDAAPITWNGAGGGDWDAITSNWTADGGATTTTFTDDGSVDVIFDNAAGGTIVIAPDMSPLSTTVSAGNYTFSGSPLDAGSLTKSGAGTLTLMVTPANFSSIAVQGGTLYLRADQFAPNGASFNMTNVTVESGAFIQGERANIVGNLTMNGGTWWDNNGFAGSWTGPVTLNANSFFGRDGWSQGLTINGTISGTGGFTKRGGSALVLTGANSDYTGKTIVEGGTLLTGGSAYLSNAGIPGVFGAATGANATIDLHNGVTLQNNGSSPRVNQSTDRTLNLAGTGPGTVSIKYNDNDASLTFGAVTATGTGSKTLAVFTGINNSGDREAIIFTGGISDSTDLSPTSLAVTFNTQGSPNWVSISGANTFTGPITLTQINGTANGVLVVGGMRSAGNPSVNTVGTGTLGNGNYPGDIALGTRTVFEYDSSAAQILAGAISGNGSLQVTGNGPLTLSGLNTYAGNTTVNAGAKLRLTQKAALGTNTSVYLSNSGELELDFADPDMVQVAKLFVNGVEQPVGLYKAVGSAASGTELAQITSTSTGRLLVGIPLVADFTATPAISGDAPLPVTFTDSSVSILGTLNSWSWDFGDGNTSTLQNPPLHTYGLWGTYTVTLTVGDTTGLFTTTSQTITVTQPLDVVVSSAAQYATVTVNVDPAGSVTFNTGVVNPVFGGLTGSGSFALADQSATPVTLQVGSDTVANTTFGGVLTGAGGLTKIGTNTFVLSGQNTYAGTTTVNDGILRIASGLIMVPVANHSFEAPTTGGFSEGTTPTSWTLSSGVGISRSGQPYIGPTCPDGLQGAFTKSSDSNYSYLGQAIDFPSGGNYIISFYAINRNGFGCPIDVKVDDNVLATITASNSAWNQYTVTADLAAGSHTLTFANTQLGDKSVNFDLVTIQTSAQAGSIGAGPVYVNSPGQLELAFSGTQSVASLYLDGIKQATGTWGSADSTADNKNDSYFSGTGVLIVGTGGSTFASWAAAQEPAVTGGVDGDANLDGVQNGIAYFMNDAGRLTHPGLDGTNTVSWTNGGNIAAGEYGSQFAVQTSTDLVEWTPVPNDGSDPNLSNTEAGVSYTLPPGAAGGKLFVRLVVMPN